jgi:hypothetical protein
MFTPAQGDTLPCVMIDNHGREWAHDGATDDVLPMGHSDRDGTDGARDLAALIAYDGLTFTVAGAP